MSNKTHRDKLAVIANQKTAERAYWLEQLAGTPGKSHFPFDFEKNTPVETGMETKTFKLQGELFSKLIKLSSRSDIKLNMILVATLQALLARYTGGTDIIVGAPIYKQETDRDFINTVLPLRNRVEDGMTFKQLLLQVRETLNNAVKNQNYPVELLAGPLNIPVSGDESPFFDIAVLLHNIHHKTYLGEGRYHMLFAFNRREHDIEAELEFNPSLYRRGTIEQITRHFTRLLENVVPDVELELSGVDILSPQEKQRMLVEFNDNRVDFPGDKTFHRLFEDQVEKTPHGVAVTGGANVQVTYRELNRRALRLARLLKEKGVGPDNIVALLAEPSREMIVGILGILKSGGAYLPIEPGYPRERIDYMLADSGAGLILGVGQEGIEITGACPMAHAGTAGPSSLAYVIYTSGSTGKPRGVAVEHRNLAANLFAFLREFKLTPSDIVVQLTSFVFDAFVEEVFPLLVTGGKIAVPPAGKMTDMEETAAFIRDRGVTVIDCSPLLLNEFNKLDPFYLASVRFFISGGDVLKPGYIDGLLKIGAVYNTYGPTETTVCVTYYRCLDGAPAIPIGKPISNYSVCILDRGGRLLPPGVPGELCVSGPGVTRGYLNNPELTNSKFKITNHKILTPSYRTGDRARWLPDGNVEFLGRIDQQVKIRGFRIELGEIESKLLAHEDIDSAVVVQKTDETGNKYLCGYIVSGRLLEASYLRDYLAEKLPDYMIPWFFLQLDRLPLTPGGKIDRKALPEIESGDAVEYIPPRDPMEKELVHLWADVLSVGIENIGIDTGFFDLGGNSMKGIILVSAINKKFNVEVSLEDIFNIQTVRGIARNIKEAGSAHYSAIEKVEEKEYYALSPAQKRLYALRQLDPDSTSYNMPGFVMLEGKIEKEKLEETFGKLIHRHESLRTSFHIIDGNPVQKVARNVEFTIEYDETSGDTGDGAGRFIRPFDLSRAPLLRAGLTKTGDREHILMTDIHHIVSDAVSHNVLMMDFLSIYRGDRLGPLTLQYRDYSEWQNSENERERKIQQERYWLNRFPGPLPVLDLPTDFPRPADRTFEGRVLEFHVGKDDTDALTRCARGNGASLQMVMLALLNILLSKLTNREDIVIGIPTAGRRHPDLEKIIGVFVNSLALRNFPGGDKTFSQFLAEVRENSLKAYDNQDYPFEDLVKKVAGGRDAARNPLFDVMLEVRENAAGTVDMLNFEIPDLKVIPYKTEIKTSKIDLDWFGTKTDHGINVEVHYSTELFTAESVKKLTGRYMEIMGQVLENENIPLREIKISHRYLGAKSTDSVESRGDFAFDYLEG